MNRIKLIAIGVLWTIISLLLWETVFDSTNPPNWFSMIVAFPVSITLLIGWVSHHIISVSHL